MRHRFPSLQIDVAFEAASPGITVLFGPSGSGKSTVIAAAAGLLRADDCRIVVDGHVLADTAAGAWLPPERRRVGMVFQDARLFPHMSVLSNLRFGLRRAPPGPVRLEEVVDLLGIAPLLGRRPGTLSGGERQRVAIGRALLAQPHLLLMDEPLASLDAARKAEILPFLARLKASMRLPVLYVTHAADEVVRLADWLVMIEAGRVRAAGPLPEIAARPDLPFGPRDDAGAVLLGYVAAHNASRGLTRIAGAGVTLWVPRLAAAIGSNCRLRIPASEVILAGTPPEAISVQNIVPCTVVRVVEDAARQAALVELALPEGALLARVTPDAVRRLGLTPGVPVIALVKSTSISVMPG